MAVKLRLKRMGSKQKPFYRVVAADSRSPRDGRFIETVGTYDPVKKEESIMIDEEKALKNDIQDLVNEYNKDIERLMKEKEQELMTI